MFLKWEIQIAFWISTIIAASCQQILYVHDTWN